MQPSLHRRPWFPWMLVGVCAIGIITLSLLLVSGHAQAQRARKSAAQSLYSQLDQVLLALTNAEDAVGLNDQLEARLQLRTSTAHLNLTTRSLATYQFLSGTDALPAEPVHQILDAYRTAASDLEAALDDPSIPSDALTTKITALRQDVGRFQDTFSVVLLTTGTVSELTETTRMFCRDLIGPVTQDRACRSYR